MAGRPPQPLEIAKLKGAVKHDPQRYRNVPSGSPMEIGQPPEGMRQGAKVIWFELLGCAPPGVVTASERVHLELAANFMLEYRNDPFNFSAAKVAQLNNAIQQLGMGSVARRKIAVPSTKPKENSFAQFVTKQ